MRNNLAYGSAHVRSRGRDRPRDRRLLKISLSGSSFCDLLPPRPAAIVYARNAPPFVCASFSDLTGSDLIRVVKRVSLKIVIFLMT